jgi:hypothetical protein
MFMDKPAYGHQFCWRYVCIGAMFETKKTCHNAKMTTMQIF